MIICEWLLGKPVKITLLLKLLVQKIGAILYLTQLPIMFQAATLP